MCSSLRVRWTITPTIAPQPWITCSGCGSLRPFQSSNKIRLNANGRKLDAWLIYKCTSCDGTWNRTIFERRNIRDIDSAVLGALQSNDPDWIRTEAFNLEDLRRRYRRIDEFAELEVRKELLDENPGWTHLEIQLAISLPTCVRLDRFLASELPISRSRLSAMHEAGLLAASPARAGILRRRIRDGLHVTVDMSDLDGRERWRSQAVGEEA